MNETLRNDNFVKETMEELRLQLEKLYPPREETPSDQVNPTEARRLEIFATFRRGEITYDQALVRLQEAFDK